MFHISVIDKFKRFAFKILIEINVKPVLINNYSYKSDIKNIFFLFFTIINTKL